VEGTVADVGSLISLDRGSPVPLYFQVAQELQRLVETGYIPAGTRLENEIQLADQLGVSRPTMRRAIGYLVERGLLVRRRGVGTQVVRSRVQRPIDLTSLYDDLASAGRNPTTKVLELATVPADDAAADALEVPPGSPIEYLVRLRSADGEPIAVMSNYLPVGLVKLDRTELEQQGLYEIIRRSGIHMRVAEQSIGARIATTDEAKLLGEKRGAPLLTMTRTAYDDFGRPVEYGSHIYRASRYNFSLTLVER
jgi:DNA-binding GntR family transcriptional regulator